MVTNGTSVRSRSGSRGLAAASAAARSTASGKSGVTFISAWIAAIPSRSVSAETVSSPVRTVITRLLGMPSTLAKAGTTEPLLLPAC